MLVILQLKQTDAGSHKHIFQFLLLLEHVYYTTREMEKKATPIALISKIEETELNGETDRQNIRVAHFASWYPSVLELLHVQSILL